FAGLLSELAGLVRRVDQAYAQALVGRRPERLPARLRELDLGPQAPLFAARAALRAERRAEALAALAGASFPPGSPEARAAAALTATLEGAPPSTRRAAWDAAVAAAPTWSWLYLRRAECRVLSGDHAGARDDFDAAAA